MSRTTQFVGLTSAGTAFTETLEATGQHIGAHGIAGEDIEMGQWRDADGNEYREVEQVVAFSSGPCIFTCLEARWANEEPPPTPPAAEAAEQVRSRLEAVTVGGADIDAATAFEMLVLLDACPATRLCEWTLDPSLRDKSEWDYDRGAYWI